MSLSAYTRIIIHCGLHKTASSYIQSVLNNNTRILSEHGIHYPSKNNHNGNHSIIAMNYKNTVPVDRLFGNFVSLNSSCPTLLLSGEEFARHLPRNGFLNAFLDAAPKAKVEFLFYLRRVDHLRESVYSESVKNKLSGDITGTKFQFDFHATIKPFIDAVGKENVIIRPYNAKKWPQGSYGMDFFSAIGQPDIWSVLAPPEKSRVNASLSRQETFLLSVLEAREDKLSLLDYFVQAPLMVNKQESKFFMSPDERRQFRLQHAPTAQLIGDIFGIPDMQDYLGTDDDETNSSWRPFEPDWKSLFKYFAWFCNHQSIRKATEAAKTTRARG